MVRAEGLPILLLIAACTPDDSTVTLCGEVLQRGADPDAFAATIDYPELPGVAVISERGKISVGVFQRDTCSPYLQLGDRDGDGVFDLLTYSALSTDGENIVDVEDYGMDGQPDLILNYAESTASVYYRGNWYSVDGVGNNGVPPSVDIGGERRPLKDILEELGRQPF